MKKTLLSMMFFMLVLCGCSAETSDNNEYVLETNSILEEQTVIDETRTIIEEPEIIEFAVEEETIVEQEVIEEALHEYVMEDYSGVILNDAIEKLVKNKITNVVAVEVNGSLMEDDENAYERL